MAEPGTWTFNARMSRPCQPGRVAAEPAAGQDAAGEAVQRRPKPHLSADAGSGHGSAAAVAAANTFETVPRHMPSAPLIRANESPNS